MEALKWVSVEEAMADQGLAFDHAQLIAQAIASTRAEVQNMQLPDGYLPAEFTLGELQSMCEALLGRRLDKSSFRRRLDDAGVVSEVTGGCEPGHSGRRSFTACEPWRLTNAALPTRPQTRNGAQLGSSC